MRAQGFDVHVGELDQLGLPEGGFDVVSIVEVVEHVHEPRSLLADASRVCCAPVASLYLTTPHGGASRRACSGRGGASSPRPSTCSSSRVPGLRLALERRGLAVASMRTHAVNPNELLARLAPRSGAAARDERVEAATRSTSRSRRAVPGRCLKAAANAVL